MGEAERAGDGSLLRAWLTMLGWHVEIEPDGRMHVGVARHVTADGGSIVVGACAATASEAVWQLFDGAIRALCGDEGRGRTAPKRGGASVAA